MSSSSSTSSPKLLSSLGQRIKSHHESLNAAYGLYYTGNSASLSTSRSSSTSSSHRASTEHSERPHEETMSPRNYQKAFKAVSKLAKDHHDSVNAAVSTYYAPVTPGASSVASSAAASPRASVEAHRPEHVDHAGEGERNITKLWKAVAKKAKEHHQSVNAAANSYYGVAIMP